MTASLLLQPAQQLLEINKGRYVWLAAPLHRNLQGLDIKQPYLIRPTVLAAFAVQLSFFVSPFFNFLTCHSQRPWDQSGLHTNTLHLPLLNGDDAKEELYCRNTPLVLWVVFSLCTLHLYPKAREIKGICLMEVSLGEISKEFWLINMSAVSTHKTMSIN